LSGLRDFFNYMTIVVAELADLRIISELTSDVTQALGAVGGAMAIKEVMPPKYSHMIGGPALKVDLHTGAIAEGVLTFVITFLVLFILLKGPRSEFMKTLLMAMSTVAMILAGSAYTGPSMNPILVSD
ncbi:aquaporin SIP1-2-like, partial [Trifolium medium]|nr:aquaporin SIP1-2-like [Trifolium medium]